MGWPQRGLAGWAVLLVAGSFLPAWQTDLWWVRLWDYPRLQVAALLAATILLMMFLRSRGQWSGLALPIASAAALAWQASHFLAFIPPYSKEVASAERCAPERSIRLLNINVLQDNDRHAEVLALVERTRPDVLLMLETDARWARAMTPLHARYPWRLEEPLPNTYGLMLYSRLPMAGELRHLVQPDIPSALAMIRLRGGEWVRFHGLHPEPPLPGDDSGERDAELVMVGREARREGRAAILMGDLNDVAWSRTSRLFQRVAGVGDPRVGRGFYPTFNANWPLLRWPLDHLFASRHWQLVAMDRLGDVGSDHFPMLYTMCLTDSADRRKAAPVADPAVEAEAGEELAEGKAETREERRD